MKNRRIELSDPNSEWISIFEKEKEILTEIFGEAIQFIHHIGSTAIPGIRAKPIVDILVEAKNISKVDQFNSKMEAMGYEVKGENGILGRRYFQKEVAEKRVSHVHIFQVNDIQVKRHLAFRNALIADSKLANQYEEIKLKALAMSVAIPEEYQKLKSGFIEMVTAKATNEKSAV